MDRLLQRNVLALSGRAVEAAGDVDVLLLDKTGTITLGNRMASAFLPLPGVNIDEMTVSYTHLGGTVPNPTYEQVCTGRTGHAEAVRVTYDPAKVSFEELARLFFEIHDPTQINRQGPDIGTQSRSAIFYKDDRQKATALSLMEKLREPGYAVATELLPASAFYPAEAYHQDFTARTGRGGCHLRVSRFGV